MCILQNKPIGGSLKKKTQTKKPLYFASATPKRKIVFDTFALNQNC